MADTAEEGAELEGPALPTAMVAAVLRWFTATARPLPWRAPDRTAWGVLVSEFMLQQTPVDRVLPIWQEWLRRWPTPMDLAYAAESDVLRKEDAVSPGAGIALHVKPGDPVHAGMPVMTLYTDEESRLPGALAALDGAWAVGPQAGDRLPLVLDRID